MKRCLVFIASLMSLTLCLGCQKNSSQSSSSISENNDTSSRIPGYNPYGKEYFLSGKYQGNNWNVFESFTLNNEKNRYEIKKTFAAKDSFMFFEKQNLMDGWVVNRGSSELDLENNGWGLYTEGVKDTSSPGSQALNFSIKEAGTYVLYYFADIVTYNCPDTAFGIEVA